MPRVNGPALNRRLFLKYAGAVIAGGVLTATAAKSPASEPNAQASMPAAKEPPSAGDPSRKITFSLIIDDGSPVDPMYYSHPGYETPLLVPLAFTQRVAETFERFNLRGKFTVIPMPSCLGRIDQSLQKVPAAHLADFLKVVRDRIAPRFDITPEFLTHLNAYNLKQGDYRHLYEDVWITQAPLAEIVDYFILAFQILNQVGLPATGITSPWVAGIEVEKKYAQALADAQWQVFGRKLTWYFLHSTSWGKARSCSLEYENAQRGQVVISVPANSADIFWSMERPSAGERRAFIQQGIDRLLSPDGQTGRIPELIQAGAPVVLLTHRQSLFTQGTALGLDGLCTLAERIHQVLGDQIEWISCSELARRWHDRQAR